MKRLLLFVFLGACASESNPPAQDAEVARESAPSLPEGSANAMQKQFSTRHASSSLQPADTDLPICTPEDPCCNASPIIVDVNGDGFNLTDPAGGVTFDLRANGRPKKFAWTAPESDDAWLALDRNGNGVIDDGAELFGNYSAQPISVAPNGFIALAVLDEVEAGGNHDGSIDSNDGAFAQLRLWRDINHDGVSQPAELIDLPKAGVKALGLRYRVANLIDEHGNDFRYSADVYSDVGAHVGPLAYDVFLRAAPAGASAETDGSGTTNAPVWRWRCTSSCNQAVLPPWDPAVNCYPNQLNALGSFYVKQTDACLGANISCVTALNIDTTRCKLTAVSCGNCIRTLIDNPVGCD